MVLKLIMFVFSLNIIIFSKECEILLLKAPIEYFNKRGVQIGKFYQNTYAFPADSRISDLMFLDWISGCGCKWSESDVRNNLKEVRVKIVDNWEEVYVDPSKAELFKYVPKLIENTTPKFTTYDGRATVIIDQKQIMDDLTFKKFKKPEITNSFFYRSTKEKVWAALVEVMAKYQFSIETIDATSGIIIAKTHNDPVGKAMECPTLFASSYFIKFNVFVKTLTDSSKITINTTFSAFKDNSEYPVECFSNGKIETLFNSEIESLLESNAK